MNAVMSGQTVMASLVGYKLSGTALNTLPMAIQMVAVMRASVVAGYAFPRLGRRGGFWLGCGIMMIGSLTFALGIYTGNFVIYCLGAIPAGAGLRHLPAPALRRGRGRRSARQGAGDLAGAGRRRGGGDHRAGDGEAHQRADPATTSSWRPICTCRCCRCITAILLSFVQVPPAQKKTGDPGPVPDDLRASRLRHRGGQFAGRLRDDEPGHGLDAAADAAVRLRRGGERRRDPRAFDRDVPARVRHRAADPDGSACTGSS